MAIEFLQDAEDVPQVWDYRTETYRLSQIAYLNLNKVNEAEIRLIGLLCPQLEIL